MSIIPDGLTILNTAASRLFRLRKSVLNSARIIADQMKEPAFRKYKALFITLTYRPGVEWSPDHISTYTDAMGQWFRRQGVTCRYVWVAELQTDRAAGRPLDNCVHYHVMLWLPRHLLLPKADKRGWWPHGSSNTQVAIKPVGYMAKYASKASQKEGCKFPPGIRLHGCGGLSKFGRAEVRWWNLPKWARNHWPLARCLSLRRAVGGGVVDLDTGEVEKGSYERMVFLRHDGAPWVVFRDKNKEVTLPKWMDDLRAQGKERTLSIAPALGGFHLGQLIERSAYQRLSEPSPFGAYDVADYRSRIDWLLSLPSSVRGEDLEIDHRMAGWSGMRCPAIPPF